MNSNMDCITVLYTRGDVVNGYPKNTFTGIPPSMLAFRFGHHWYARYYIIMVFRERNPLKRQCFYNSPTCCIIFPAKHIWHALHVDGVIPTLCHCCQCKLSVEIRVPLVPYPICTVCPICTDAWRSDKVHGLRFRWSMDTVQYVHAV